METIITGAIGVAAGAWSITWGALHWSTPCPAAPALATWLVVMGAMLCATGVFSVFPHYRSKKELLFYAEIFCLLLALMAQFGILIWGTVLAFDGDRWTKIVHGGVADPAAICDPHLYTPAAITAICLWVVAPVLGVLFTCGLFCFSCVALSTTKKTGAAKRIGGGLGSNASGSEDTGDESIWVDRAARRWRIGKPIVTLVRKCLRRSLPVEVQRQEDARQKRQEEREEEGEATPFTADGTPSPAAFVPDARFFFGGGGAAKRKQ